jgi:Rrf2 family protein
MQIPVKAHYAAVAMLALAARYDDGELVSARTIALEHEVPSQFLVQILQLLRSAGLISSSRGASGGFKLLRSPDAISLAEVVDAVCAFQPSGPTECEASNLNRVMVQVWGELIQQQRQSLQQISLRELLARSASASEAMYYI